MQQVQRERWSAVEPRRPLMVLVVVGVVLLAVVAALVVASGSSGDRVDRSSAIERQVDGGPQPVGSMPTGTYEDLDRAQRAVSWLSGLASGRILPTDVTGRLQQQDEQLARLVMSAWRRLERP